MKQHNRVKPMIPGWKTLPYSVPQPRMVGHARAILLGCCSLAAAALASA
jgi:hypothetical protein